MAKGTIKIGTTEVGMAANAATPYFFKSVFKKDIMKTISHLDDDDADETTDAIFRLGYVMANQYENTPVSDMSEAGFLDWLMHFEYMDLVSASQQILKMYLGTNQTTSKAKNRSRRRPGK